jgi:hypothetical protein
MRTLLWIFTLISSLIGGFFLLSSFAEKAAPQQAAAAAIGVGFAVIPYCFARAVTWLASNATARTCPHCAEPVRPVARVCPWCSRAIAIVEAPIPAGGDNLTYG